MRHTHREELFSRSDGNPILTAADCPHTANAVFNPAAVRFEGETLLLVRVEDRPGISHLCVARSADGLTGWVTGHAEVLGPYLALLEPRPPPLGDHTVLLHAREGGVVGRTQDRTEHPTSVDSGGWLLLYHGVRTTAAGSLAARSAYVRRSRKRHARFTGSSDRSEIGARAGRQWKEVAPADAELLRASDGVNKICALVEEGYRRQLRE